MAIPGFRYPTRLCYFRCVAALADISPVGFVGLIIFIAVDLGTNFGAAATMLMDANWNGEEDERHSQSCKVDRGPWVRG